MDLLMVIGALASVTTLFYGLPESVLGGPSRQLGHHLFYIPVILAAMRLGLAGGLTAGLVVIAALIPHQVDTWRNDPSDPYMGLRLEGALYLFIGAITGALADRRRQVSSRLGAASRQLESTCQDLKGKSEELTTAYAKLRRRAQEAFEWQEHVRRAERFSALGRLTAGLADQIRNPLGAMKGAVDILRDQKPNDERGAELLEILAKETDRLNSVIKSFLAFADSVELPPGSADLDRVVREAFDAARQDGQHEGVQTFYEAQTPGLSVAVPHEHLRQVLVNMIHNSFGALNGGGRVAIRSRQTQPQANGRPLVELAIEDTGVGLAPGVIDKIFDPFYTTHPDRVGLGLAIAQRVVTDCGGQIRLDPSYTRGARFLLLLPEHEN
jgi:signal transduction histidine kinase